jgi:chromosome partitioning protein
MDLLPSNILLSAAEVQLHSALAREWRLKQVLSPVQNNYNFVLVDCPPTLGFFSISSLVASTHVLVPIQTHFKAFLGVELLLDSIRQVRERINPELAIIALLSLQENKNSSQRMKALLNGQSSDRKLIETYVLSPYNECPSVQTFQPLVWRE